MIGFDRCRGKFEVSQFIFALRYWWVTSVASTFPRTIHTVTIDNESGAHLSGLKAFEAESNLSY